MWAKRPWIRLAHSVSHSSAFLVFFPLARSLLRAAVLAIIAAFGVWDRGCNAQAFFYFQFEG